MVYNLALTAEIARMLEAPGRDDHLLERPVPETHAFTTQIKPSPTSKGSSPRGRRALCTGGGLIQNKKSDIALSALGERSPPPLGRKRREVTETDVPADTIYHTSCNKAKGLDARAVILLRLSPFANCEDDFTAHSLFWAPARRGGCWR